MSEEQLNALEAVSPLENAAQDAWFMLKKLEPWNQDRWNAFLSEAAPVVIIEMIATRRKLISEIRRLRETPHDDK